MSKRYEVLTWDIDRQEFTPQRGIRRGPYGKWGLRKVLRKLQAIGYDVRRNDAPSVLVQEVST